MLDYQMQKWKKEIDTVGGLHPKERALIARLRSLDAPELYSKIDEMIQEAKK